MKKVSGFLICLILFFFTMNGVFAAIGEWTVPLDVSGGQLAFGTEVGATDGFDFNVDVPAPPLSPGAQKDIHFRINDPFFSKLQQDYRSVLDSNNPIETWELAIVTDENIQVQPDVQFVPSNIVKLNASYDSTVINLMETQYIELPAGTYSILITAEYGSPCTDSDNDTYSKEGGTCGKIDCNDANSSINPGASEVCNGVDDNCNTEIDEGVKITFYRDGDGDNFGDSIDIVNACVAPAGYIGINSDCDDTNSSINPSAAEICNGVDDNCNLQIDEGVKLTFYRDADIDGFGDSGDTVDACIAPIGYINVNTDCNDSNSSINPSASEKCNGVDDNCDTNVDEGLGPTPTSCGVGECSSTGELVCFDGTWIDDCTPGDPVPEVCDDGNDNDCDGAADEIDECGTVEYYCDEDQDNYVSAFVSGTCTGDGCEPADCQLSSGDDCDDDNKDINPGATEVCNGVDDNCDTQVDENLGTTPTTCGVGECGSTGELACVGGQWIDDCTPGTPGAEVCDGNDNDCDGTADESEECAEGNYHCDLDKDGYKSSSATFTCVGDICTLVPGIVPPFGLCPPPIPGGADDCALSRQSLELIGCTIAMGDDCIDNDSSVNPGATEVCNGIDENCDTLVDEGLGVTPTTCGVGECGSTGELACVGGQWIDDCTPGTPGTEVCDGNDNDCDGFADEELGTTPTTCGVGECGSTGELACVGGQWIDDCTPGAPVDEVCEDGLDNDCDGIADEAEVCGTIEYYCDEDQDNYVSAFVSGTCTGDGCEPADCQLSSGDDCDDDNKDINPGATEVCNGVDDNCDTQVDENLGTTPTTCGVGECGSTGELACVGGQWIDDCTPGTPGAEVCDGNDNDCDGFADEELGTTPTTCGVGECGSTGELACVGGQWIDDCTPGTPGAEVCDGNDNDCDGFADEELGTTPTTCGVGECGSTGELACVGGQWIDDCTPGAPVDEVCEDGLDNDCDGTADESEECAEGNYHCDLDKDGYKSSSATFTCVGDICTLVPGIVPPFGLCPPPIPGGADDCALSRQSLELIGCTIAMGDDCIDNDSSVNPGATEVCNGIDENCDTLVDEGLGVTPTTCGVGECGSTGELACVGGQWIDDCTPGTPGAEVCDGNDNDCDGFADEELGTTPTTCGVGECGSTGELACVGGQWIDDCTPGDPSDEVCEDGLDNDCNGEIDDPSVCGLDKTPPTIEGVWLDIERVIEGSVIHVTVQAADDVGVSSVTANGAPLTMVGDKWEGDITVPMGSSLGDHPIVVTAKDDAGNSDKETKTYTVVIPTGGVGIITSPKPLVLTSNPGVITIKLVSTASFDDKVKVTLSNSGVPPTYALDLYWLSQTDISLTLKSGEIKYLTIDVNGDLSDKGFHIFNAKAYSEGLKISSSDNGVIYVP